MKPNLRTLFACCAAGALAVSLAACEPEDPRKTATSQMALADGGYEPGWSMMDLAGVDPAFYRDDYDALPQALPMKSNYVGDYGEAAGYGHAPAYDYAPDFPDSQYEPLDESYYYDDGPYEDGYVQDGYYEDGDYGDAYYDGSYYGGGSYDLASDSNDFALLALAVALAGMLGDSPPDYGFAYDGVSPWAWQTGDRYFRYAEPIDSGYRYYYYEPDAHRPFLVSDPYYSYGYRGDRLVAVYDSAGRRIDARRAELQLRAAKAYYARAERLHRAAKRDRFGVSAPLWERHRDRISRDRNDWQKVRAERPAWQRWEARNAPRLYHQWSDEALVRRDAERGFAKWQRADYRTPAPKFYTREARREQVRNLAELRRDRAEELAERRRARAEQQIERRRTAERTEKAEQRRERVSRIAERREATAERRQQFERQDRREVSDTARSRRVAIRQEAREAREQASARREGNAPSARLAEQRREQRQAAAAERREEQRAEAQRRKERAATSARTERPRKLAAAQETRRQDASRARAEDRQRAVSERREARQREQQARREAQQREQQARREQAQAEASRQRAQAADADRRAQREQARREAETRRAQQAEARQAQTQREARQAQVQSQQAERARAAQQQTAREGAQARQEARQLARQERQEARKERREQRQNRN